ncbi:uncharacterized protein MONOS_18261 [Monocercomonoides exilis]|uniref:uncharacterized protein n=1 Tax=Monocercomonoides exilis TaxID=2049356 RepID=UPI003559F0E2|nr:hypothetical protein MONOS_18261 [Monocercomonoides exilis]
MTAGFESTARAVISNKGGELWIKECAFHSEAQLNNGFECVFVDVNAGVLGVNGLSMDSSCVGKSVLQVEEVGAECNLSNMHISSLNETGGCVISVGNVVPSTAQTMGMQRAAWTWRTVRLRGMKRSDNEASVLVSKSEKGITVRIRDCLLVDGKAETSDKGGGMLFGLHKAGRLSMVKTTMSRCSCESNSGKGGGVYLESKERGALSFVFEKVSFSANTAGVGNDIFVECYNISCQINETQFRFDLREESYARLNAIYGSDATEHTGSTNLIDFITIHQSDTIIVSGNSGVDERQCGTRSLPCQSIDYGLAHLTADFISQMFVDGESAIKGEVELDEMSLSSRSRDLCNVEVESRIECTRASVISTSNTVTISRVRFVFDMEFASSHVALVEPDSGLVEMVNCSFSSKHTEPAEARLQAQIPFHIIQIASGRCVLDGCCVADVALSVAAICIASPIQFVVSSCVFCDLATSDPLIDVTGSGEISANHLELANVTVSKRGLSLLSCSGVRRKMKLNNCSIKNSAQDNSRGMLITLGNCSDAVMDSCLLDGNSSECDTKESQRSSVMMKDTTICNSSKGGITVSGGSVGIEMGVLKQMRKAEMEVVFKGKLLLPCNLSFMIVKQIGEEKQIEKYGEAGDEAEVSVCILFGDGNNPSSTDSFILKNRSEPKANGDERIVEGGKKEIVLVVDLEESREGCREKNEERMKKRIYDTNLQHSESSEHLLSESGSTEYILGRDSDKIPQWMLEKDEEEEIRKRTPSPSISSTSTTSTTDSDSTFVRGEDLCPTTSSMSNLVDAMACSSPHEKLIKKEMAIDTLQEREMAAQILFWVANGALHSFDEMENPLQSLGSLSPHIVLFSEHMVICITMHSDCSSGSDTSSSISSATVVTSASDVESDSLPSSAFEDDEDNKKSSIRGSEMCEAVENGLDGNPERRASLMQVKRYLVGRLPSGYTMATVSDAIAYCEGSEECGSEYIERSGVVKLGSGSESETQTRGSSG